MTSSAGMGGRGQIAVPVVKSTYDQLIKYTTALRLGTAESEQVPEGCGVELRLKHLWTSRPGYARAPTIP